jgi:hypothetical protein
MLVALELECAAAMWQRREGVTACATARSLPGSAGPPRDMCTQRGCGSKGAITRVEGRVDAGGGAKSKYTQPGRPTSNGGTQARGAECYRSLGEGSVDFVGHL